MSPDGWTATSRHDGYPPDPDRPLYARVLRLRHLDPGGVQCFLLFEAVLAFGALLALAELVPWWGALALPAVVAVMVKLNDLIAGSVSRSYGHGPAGWRAPAGRAAGDYRRSTPGAGFGGPSRSRARRSAADWEAGSHPSGPDGFDRPGQRLPPAGENTSLGLAYSLNVLQVADSFDSPKQRARQAAVRRYE